MTKYNFSAIGIVEISFYTNALTVLDEMLKTSDVNLIHWEKRLGGRMVSIIIGGDTSAVQSAIDVAKSMGREVGEKNIKIAITIPSPHPEIIKLIYKERKQSEIKQRQSLTENKANNEVIKKKTNKEEESELEPIEEKPKQKKKSRRKKDESSRND